MQEPPRCRLESGQLARWCARRPPVSYIAGVTAAIHHLLRDALGAHAARTLARPWAARGDNGLLQVW